MTYQTAETRFEAIDSALAALRGKETAVLTTHINGDGDGCGSEIALLAWLRELGTEAFIVNPTPVPQSFQFLIPDESWVVDSTSVEAQELCDGADVAVVLDTGEVPRIGRVRPLIDGLPTVVIDHHPPGDRPIEGVSFRDSNACATGELVFDLIHRAGGPWPAIADLAMYVAIMTDTGSFRFSNTTPASLRIAAELVDRGVSPDETYRRIYGTVPRRRFHLARELFGFFGGGRRRGGRVDDRAGRPVRCSRCDRRRPRGHGRLPPAPSRVWRSGSSFARSPGRGSRFPSAPTAR